MAQCPVIKIYLMLIKLASFLCLQTQTVGRFIIVIKPFPHEKIFHDKFLIDDLKKMGKFAHFPLLNSNISKNCPQIMK